MEKRYLVECFKLQNIWFMDRKFKKEVQEACKFLRETGRKCLNERMAAMAWGDEVPEDILTYVVRTKGTKRSFAFLYVNLITSCVEV